jgi:hypothetical protein
MANNTARTQLWQGLQRDGGRVRSPEALCHLLPFFSRYSLKEIDLALFA